MKKVISISLGSSRRDHTTRAEILGETFEISRRGTDGDARKAKRLFEELDGQYDAFGVGGTDLYIYAGGRRYKIRDAHKLVENVRKTPVVDGSGLKNTLERRAVKFLQEEYGYDFQNKKVLMVCAVDRFGLAEALARTGCDIVFGDLIFGLKVPIPIKSLRTLELIAKALAPVVTKLPFSFLYPTGKKQEESKTTFARYYEEADLIAGDFHFIKRYLPERVPGKVIITNTVTADDLKDLKRRGIKTLVTTTPEFQGRSFGTNVMEGVLVALAGKSPEELSSKDYDQLLDKIGFLPRVVNLQEETAF